MEVEKANVKRGRFALFVQSIRTKFLTLFHLNVSRLLLGYCVCCQQAAWIWIGLECWNERLENLLVGKQLEYHATTSNFQSKKYLSGKEFLVLATKFKNFAGQKRTTMNIEISNQDIIDIFETIKTKKQQLLAEEQRKAKDANSKDFWTSLVRNVICL